MLDSSSTPGNNGHTPSVILRGSAAIITITNTADSVKNSASAIWTVSMFFHGHGSVATGAARTVRIGAGARVNGSGVAHIISRLNPVQAISRTVEIISIRNIDFALLHAGA